MAGSIGKIEICNDFLGIYDSVVWGVTNLVAGDGLGGVGFASVNEGSFASTVDEPGGILAVTTDTGDNDNGALLLGKFKPADGVMVFETRFKYNNMDCAVFAGFRDDGARHACHACRVRHGYHDLQRHGRHGRHPVRR